MGLPPRSREHDAPLNPAGARRAAALDAWRNNQTSGQPIDSIESRKQNFQAFASPAKDIVGGFERYQWFARAAWGAVGLTNATRQSRPGIDFQIFKQPHEYTSIFGKSKRCAVCVRLRFDLTGNRPKLAPMGVPPAVPRRSRPLPQSRDRHRPTNQRGGDAAKRQAEGVADRIQAHLRA